MSQKDFEIIMELKPLETLFTQLSDEKKALYVEDLREFGIDVIRAAVHKVRKKWDRVSFPPPGAIVAECNALAGGRVGIQSGGAEIFGQRERDIETVVRDYCVTFMRDSNIAFECRAAGTDEYLREYVRAVASVQAQMLNPRPNGAIGLEWHKIMPEGADYEKFKYGFLRDCREQVKRGMIDVPIPTGKLDEWLIRAQRAGRYCDVPLQSRVTNTLAAALHHDHGQMPELPPTDAYEEML